MIEVDNREVRRIVSTVLEDADFMDSVDTMLKVPGFAGNRQMDQALVSEAVFKRQPQLRDDYNHKELWGHIAWLLKKWGNTND